MHERLLAAEAKLAYKEKAAEAMQLRMHDISCTREAAAEDLEVMVSELQAAQERLACKEREVVSANLAAKSILRERDIMSRCGLLSLLPATAIMNKQ